MTDAMLLLLSRELTPAFIVKENTLLYQQASEYGPLLNYLLPVKTWSEIIEKTEDLGENPLVIELSTSIRFIAKRIDRLVFGVIDLHDPETLKSIRAFLTQLPRKIKKNLTISLARCLKGVSAQEFIVKAEELLPKFREKQDLLQDIETTRAILHEIQTPIGYVRTSIESLEVSNKEEILADLAEVRFQLETMVSILNRDLRFQENAFHRRNPGAFIKEFYNRYQKRAAEKGLHIELEYCPFTSYIIPHRFELAISNLLSNAIKYSYGNSNSGNPLAVIRIAFELKDRSGLIYITNRGSHIPPEDISSGRIFEIYERGKDQSKKPGTGIGLYLAKKIIEKEHMGRLRLESKYIQGRQDQMALTTAIVSLETARN